MLRRPLSIKKACWRPYNPIKQQQKWRDLLYIFLLHSGYSGYAHFLEKPLDE
jgi:hypothetical protein